MVRMRARRAGCQIHQFPPLFTELIAITSYAGRLLPVLYVLTVLIGWIPFFIVINTIDELVFPFLHYSSPVALAPIKRRTRSCARRDKTAFRYFRWNSNSDLKDRRRDGESTKTFPLTPPSPLGRGRDVETLRQRSGNVGFDPTHRSSAPRQPDQYCTTERLPHSALPDQPSGSPSPLGRGRGEGEGISLSFTAFFSAFGPGLNSTENGEEPIKRASSPCLASVADPIAELICHSTGGIGVREILMLSR